ncbi:ABC transporter ATP-binding protein [Cuneatibacter caecimuris]|uniref:ATP-binding cassette subfamily B protein n=1 Tax=Cuneatibacter caecimuris TaxID=1796618 RepID=A0A4Q7PTD3_9FIRM|nr:ABC transporter ATP-binding protein [Cuneatibacter caecimuris]RZT02560.1 ATP-binding cassette subfamily B protein [Cuneatibacter caecimuris]
MSKLGKYLKKYWWQILIVVGFLVVQAYGDLSLPQYTSDIVDVGIQQGGIDSPVPEVIRKQQLDRILMFLPENDRQTVENSYTLLDQGDYSDSQWKTYLEKYPVLYGEALYVRNDLTEEEEAAIGEIISTPAMLISYLSSDGEEALAVKKDILSQALQKAPEDLTETDLQTDLFQIFQQMPSEALQEMAAKTKEQMGSLSEMLTDQIAVEFVKNEYTAVGMDLEKIQTRYITVTGAKMLGFSLLIMVSTIVVTFLAARVAASLSRDLRGRIFGKVLSFSNAEYDQFSTSSLITRSTNDIQQVQMMVVMLLRMLLYAPIMAAGGVMKVLGTNTSMAWIIGVAVACILAVVTVLFLVVMPKFQLLQKLIDRLNLVTREIISGLPVIRAFSRERHEEDRFEKANKDLTKVNLFVNRVMTCMMPLMMLIMNLVTVVIVWNGAHGIEAGDMQVGDMIAFISYTMQIIMSFLMLAMMSIMLPRAAVSLKRIDDVLTAKPSIEDPVSPRHFRQEMKGVVEFDHVHFAYPGAEEDVLSDITFTAEPGKTTAVIGSTGSGKSTVVNLIPRFFDVTGGAVRVDGVDIREVSRKDLRDRIGYVPQKGVLFSGTIETNIKFSDEELSDEKMERAARIAQATEFVEGKADRYDSPISQGGTNVSGGQKQRLSIARAIAKDPEIFIFDDSFSALDYKTDAVLRKTLREETKDATVIIVAQRISTILNADQILVLDEGKIVGKGTHEELMVSCEEYQQIARSQLAESELSGKAGKEAAL